VAHVEFIEDELQGGTSGSPLVTPEGAAFSLVSVGIGDPDRHTEDYAAPMLAARLPAWLVQAGRDA
jgi:hypothetical protein